MTNHCSFFNSIIVFFGRIFLSLIFVVAGLHKIMAFKVTAASLASMGVPYSELLLIFAALFELGGGLLILLGWHARFGAFLILLFIIPVTFVFHSFWDYQGAAMVNNMHHLLKNLSIMGGMLYIMACGAGHISVDGLIRKKCCQTKS